MLNFVQVRARKTVNGKEFPSPANVLRRYVIVKCSLEMLQTGMRLHGCFCRAPSPPGQVHFQLRRAKYFGCTLGEGANKLLNLRQVQIAFRSFIHSARRYILEQLNAFSGESPLRFSSNIFADPIAVACSSFLF